jgi:hypothetical protein
VIRADAKPAGTVWTLFENGPASAKVDVLLIAEGYTAAELPKFHTDAKRLVEAMFAVEPYKSRRRDFNVRGLDLASAESGVNRPQTGVFRRTPISVEYNIFDTERYMLTYDNRALRDAAAAAPYEFVEILANEQMYGGAASSIFKRRPRSTASSRITCSSTSSGTILPRSPTSTTRRTWRTKPVRRRTRSPGSRT